MTYAIFAFNKLTQICPTCKAFKMLQKGQISKIFLSTWLQVSKCNAQCGKTNASALISVGSLG